MLQHLVSVFASPEGLYLVAVLCVSMFVRAAIGVGGSVIAVTALAFVLSPAETVPILVIIGSLISIVIALQNREHIAWGAVGRTTLPALAGIPLGVALLKWGDDRVVIPILAVLVILIALYSLHGHRDIVLKGRAWSYLFGFLAGFLGGAYNFRGIAIGIYANLQGWSPRTFRSTIHTFYLTTGFFVPAAHYLGGLITAETVARIIVCLPFAVASSSLGGRFADRLDARSFHRLIWMALVVLACVLLATSLFRP